MRADDMTVLDDLARDVGDERARDREPDPWGRTAAELGIGCRERGDADDFSPDIDERPTAVPRIDRGARLDDIRQHRACRLIDGPAQRADDPFGD